MACIGLDVKIFCKYCENNILINSYRRYRYRKGQRRFFCNHSCSRKHYNNINNPMANKSTREKLSKTCKKQKKWKTNNNPNFGGENIKQLWEKGKYNNRDFKGEKNPAWIDGRSFKAYKRGEDWNIQRLKALKRDVFCCQNCYNKNDLVVHHIIPYAISNSNHINNLKTGCHGKIHAKIGWNYFNKRRKTNAIRC